MRWKLWFQASFGLLQCLDNPSPTSGGPPPYLLISRGRHPLNTCCRSMSPKPYCVSQSNSKCPFTFSSKPSSSCRTSPNVFMSSRSAQPEIWSSWFVVTIEMSQTISHFHFTASHVVSDSLWFNCVKQFLNCSTAVLSLQRDTSERDINFKSVL